MCRLRHGPARFQIGRNGRVIPVGEVGDEIEQARLQQPPVIRVRAVQHQPGLNLWCRRPACRPVCLAGLPHASIPRGRRDACTTTGGCITSGHAINQRFPPSPAFGRFLQLLALGSDPFGMDPPGERQNVLESGVAKRLRTKRIVWIGPKSCTNHRPASRQRPACPPDVQRRNMPMPNRLLPPRMRRDPGNREINFDETFRVGGRHFYLLFVVQASRLLFTLYFFLNLLNK